MQRLSESDIVFFLKSIGENPSRKGLAGTPKAFIDALKYYFSGYKCEDISSLVTKFSVTPDCASDSALITLKNIAFYSFCEHHIFPFHGEISVGYVPDKTITSIGSIRRVIEVFTRRLQLQERVCKLIATALHDVLDAQGVIVSASAKHMCSMCESNELHTSYKTGLFSVNGSPELNEFLSIIR